MCCSHASAGGQVEQPSEVNSSTSTGTAAVFPSAPQQVAAKHAMRLKMEITLFIVVIQIVMAQGGCASCPGVPPLPSPSDGNARNSHLRRWDHKHIRVR